MQVGETLPNGAKIVEKYYNTRGEYWVYRCYWEGNYMPYVTWYANKWDEGATFCGNYFLEEEKAIDDFHKRCLR